MKKLIHIAIVGVLCLLLLLIRAYENQLFYDPLLNFFKTDYKTLPLPEMDQVKLQLNIGLRFLMNSAISLGILWLIFKNKDIIKLSVFLYIILFVLLLMAFNYAVYTSEGTTSHMTLFYIRRFLIQPLFLLILLPAFYFQRKNTQ